MGYEAFAGNRLDATTVEEMVNKIESQYGQANRIWVTDRGMISQENIKFLNSGGRRYIVGTPRSQQKGFERELLTANWQKVYEGLELKLCPGEDGQETFILCRSASRAQKEKAMHDRFERRIEHGLAKLVENCNSRKQKISTMERRVGRLLEANSRAGGLFVDVVLATTMSTEIRRRCIPQPTKYQSILLDKPGLHLPKKLNYQKEPEKNYSRFTTAEVGLIVTFFN